MNIIINHRDLEYVFEILQQMLDYPFSDNISIDV